MTVCDLCSAGANTGRRIRSVKLVIGWDSRDSEYFDVCSECLNNVPPSFLKRLIDMAFGKRSGVEGK